MSIEVNWETLTSGPDGARYAENIRSFVHERFQSVPFPKFIKSVNVHSFSFGNVPPDIEIKELCDPYPEFYEDDDDDDNDDCSDSGSADVGNGNVGGEDEHDYLLKLERERRRKERRDDGGSNGGGARSPPPGLNPPPYTPDGRTGIPFRSPFTPGIPDTFPGRVGVAGVATPLFHRGGSSSNLHYFHSALSSGFTGTNTPTLPAFQSPTSPGPPEIQPHSTSTSSVPSRPSTADSGGPVSSLNITDPPSVGSSSGEPLRTPTSEDSPPRRSSSPAIPRLTEPRDQDTQIMARVRYSGDIRLELAAELLLEYPITNFVALPVRLVVTGCKFDGLACLAYIRRRAHFCFIDEEQAPDLDDGEELARVRTKSLLKEIKVESEIGEKGKGKQVLKNVGKVERFVLEQVRRIFEEEFLFPSSWTFLV
ncbi:hypothetical protein C7212DRAFT_205096 [Tuber magnatum]|uniref:Mitochondrial distribution and morphology protein 12 n=1 Tax=Tuber magnatum TaxID=42249 RepID=A0A317SMV0_9PEZI|nr:hypothetical protein C7212DRAFT_205096 [Tuber magnatum]